VGGSYLGSIRLAKNLKYRKLVENEGARRGTTKCPNCAETILADEKKCPYCRGKVK